jgi:hypothetical protein
MIDGYTLARDASGRLVATFNATPGYDGFEAVAQYLVDREGARIENRLDDGFDTRYWDLRVRDRLLTLHINWALFALSAAEEPAESQVQELAPRIAALLHLRSQATPPA